MRAEKRLISVNKREIGAMFDDIAPSYDFLNHFLSFGIDHYWRDKVIKKLKQHKALKTIDIATGTADLAILGAKKIKDSKIVGIDISDQMLRKGRRKINKRKLNSRIALKWSDGHQIECPSNEFDAATIAFGLRNFENPVKGINEMHRVLKPGGVTIILEFSTVKNRVFYKLFKFYFNKILPLIGRLVSGNKKAYNYLPKSVVDFNRKYVIEKIMREAGFENMYAKSLTFGVATMYCGTKKQNIAQ
ncbi:MAG TPA: bifunctional demethylmenaquinone methyltransferase/2-methoxy-6-polyprenyl-1,4-benzoquinol methylase UbiE [Salinivirgaceae bacterium]|nr:bifunctional demethylmenaquinone methyltransferase/2-methoxy-6-polyprenyl-1,4-benzoquinol methylase UbiE [Salinivirgaceae bacterium]